MALVDIGEYLRFIPLAATVACALIMVYGSLRDLVSFEIPNWISLAVIASFLAAAAGAGWGWGAVAQNMGAGLVVLAIGFLLYAKGYCGGGDVKLLAAATVWMGWQWLPQFILVIALFGGVIALTLLLFRCIKLPTGLKALPWIQRLHDKKSGVPYGVAIVAAALLLLPRIAILSGFISD